MKMRCAALAALCLAGLMGLATCGKGGAPAASGKPLAVASVFCYFDALRAIAGDDVEVAVLLPRGQSPHDFAATMSDRQTVARARLLVSNGLGLDDWAPRLGGGNKDLAQLVIGTKIAAIETKEEELPGGKKDEHEGHDHDHDHAHGPQNPHVWLDPENQIRAAEMIRDALIQMDPSHRSEFMSRAGIYVEDIKKLDAEFKAATANFKYKEFIGFHSAYDYLARRYGLKQVAALQEAGAEGLSVAQVQKVIQIIRDRKVPVIFTENAFNSKQVQPVVAATGVKVGVLQPLETYDRLEDTYVSLMRQNLAEMKKAME